MSEYCEYMWDTTRGHASPALARSIYEEETRFDKRDKKLAIKTVRAILREMPDVDLKHCTDEYITRFLLARKYRTEQAAALIAAYQAQVAHRQDIFGNLTARDPALQRALRAGIPGVLPARDRKGRCVLVILASQWDPIAVPALSVQRAIFLVLEILIQDPRNQQSGFVAVVDWSGFSLRQGGALGAAALRNLIAALRGRFPARFKAIHFLSAPLYVQATLALVKPFLDEKTRNKIYLHGNNLSTLHEHLPTDILPAELGGTGPAFNPGLWAEPVIHSAMKEAELAAIKKEKERAENAEQPFDKKIESKDMENHKRNEADSIKSNSGVNKENGRRFFNPFSNSMKNQSPKKIGGTNVELNLINRTNAYAERKEGGRDSRTIKEDQDSYCRSRDKMLNNGNTDYFDDKRERYKDAKDNLLGSQSERNSNEYEISNRPDSDDSKDNSLDNRSENALIETGKIDTLSEETNLIT
ncbi:PREDICTED: clavesin-2-like [Eufriesea mexicana]|uniref:clavesin-2-like n=1 Tax=Eufriesea mexicana TaxID=516756 RepID=UPI00083C6485|nr:PREDICTED: clavesin-2-like [Eufriesea mexicana]XP_017755442.1 PREDICTED: clavesin-2-like [Eufriesea mexicana]XP_017755443.1 PREDICTED: clavesin-2-like [Eufriesea mexicana]XP_017755444.1 PREDICTED: clavesin-2-like [Eufriesea mexicana]XP_017755445.1 PREDICTED: clavesin-2-like [Eufriesea mexicana]XP_017755446.1 PREDICTED: clavesin-2-like [Eufriesea mexicana]XP_017755448.1 PREDICTED: clavesin-2-like [Eufriesea mexicana]